WRFIQYLLATLSALQQIGIHSINSSARRARQRDRDAKRASRSTPATRHWRNGPVQRASLERLQARGCLRAKLSVAVIPESPAPRGRYCSIGVITATPQSVPVMVVDIPHALA